MDEDPSTASAGANSLFYSSDFDSACSTPYVSAPSSPGRSSSAASAGGYFYSAPASPMHFFLSSASVTAKSKPSQPESSAPVSVSDFEFSARGNPSPAVSADELFLNGQIRPMKLSSHLQRPQSLAPLLDLDNETDGTGTREEEEGSGNRGRESKANRDRRRTRSMSPLRNSTWHRIVKDNDKSEIKEEEEEEEETVASMSASSSRSSSGGRSSKRWIFLKEFLYRSKSEGRNNNTNNNSTSNSNNSSSNNKFWNNFSAKAKKATPPAPEPVAAPSKKKAAPTNGVGKRRGPAASAHEMHYKANRAQAEEMRKKTFLPYRQGLIGCLGFSSKGYGAVNGLARALNPVSSR